MKGVVHFSGKALRTLATAMLVMSLACVGLVLGVYLHKFHGPLADQQSIWGVFGDYVGGLLGALFAFLAFVGLMISIVLQNGALGIAVGQVASSEVELRETRAQLSRSATAQEQALDAYGRELEIARYMARLNALAAICSNYQHIIRSAATPVVQEELNRRLSDYVRELEELLAAVPAHRSK